MMGVMGVIISTGDEGQFLYYNIHDLDVIFVLKPKISPFISAFVNRIFPSLP